jgi:hypothetical protein
MKTDLKTSSNRWRHNEEQNWANIKEAILEAAKESIGYKPITKKTWIRI